MTATHLHRKAGGDRGNEQPGSRRRWSRAGGRITTLLLIPAVSAGLLLAGTVATPATAATTPAAAVVGAASGPVDVPAVSTHKKLVFAHYFTPYPISLDNKPASSDYYTINYLNPAGENGKFATSGGLLRDRPLPSTPVIGDWKLENQKTEVRQAIAAGIDGFSIDILGLTGGNWDSILSMMDAAHAVSPSFKVMLMPDMTSATGGYDQATLAGKMAILAAYPAAYRISTGALVIAPFKGEAQTPAWWTTFITTMSSSYGIKVAFLPVFLATGPNIPKYASISYGMSSWGVRNPQGILAGPDYTAQAHKLGTKWMAPIAIQDSRPNQFVYAESANTETLRASWTRAINDGADFTQLITWNDYSEMTSFAPSVNHGHAYLDINAYYQTAFQTGSTPAIARETVFLTHRTQAYDATPTYQNKQMLWWNGGTTPRNTAEVLTFLKSPATVTATVGSTVQTYTAPAGVSAKLFPLTAGTVKATAVRGGATIGTATSPFTVTKTPYVQDEEYFAVSSPPPGPLPAGSFGVLGPVRLLDTRTALGAAGPVAAGGSVALPVTGHGGVPASGVSAVVLTVTVTQPGRAGYLTAYPDGGARPTVSNLNFTAGQTVANLVIVPVGADGKIRLYNGSPGTVQLIADIAGYYRAS